MKWREMGGKEEWARGHSSISRSHNLSQAWKSTRKVWISPGSNLRTNSRTLQKPFLVRLEHYRTLHNPFLVHLEHYRNYLELPSSSLESYCLHNALPGTSLDRIFHSVVSLIHHECRRSCKLCSSVSLLCWGKERHAFFWKLVVLLIELPRGLSILSRWWTFSREHTVAL